MAFQSGFAACVVVEASLILASPAAPLASSIDAVFSTVAGGASPGVAVLVRSSGRTLFERGYGVRDVRTGVKIDAVTNFRLASLSKQFTAMATMLLVHDGKLRYDSRITDVFPDFAAYGRTITVRHMLTHTSGLPDYEELMARSATWTAMHQIQDRDVLELLKRETAGKFQPGTRWSYSNSGYVLLGLMVAKVSGLSFGRFLQERVFGPLRMDATIAWVKGDADVLNRAYGYTKGIAAFEANDQSPTSATLGDGGVYSNLADLAKWDEALERHILLSEDEMKPALTPVALANGAEPRWPVDPGDDNLAPGKPVSYGFGWFLDPWRGRGRMWHFGSTVGFRTAIERFTADRLTIVVLSNRTDLDAEALALQVAALCLDQKRAATCAYARRGLRRST